MIGQGGNGNGNGNGSGGWGAGTSTDMRRGKDREDLRRGISRGWGLTPEKLAMYREALDEALEIAKKDGNAREVRGCVRTLATMVSQVQVDEKNDRMDEGLPTERHEYLAVEFDDRG